jgi:hypothetical protein
LYEGMLRYALQVEAPAPAAAPKTESR